jgi:DNA-binding response OmpR family regulator
MSSSGARVLVVDDDPAIRSLLGMLLKRSNLAADFAPDGAQALVRLESASYAAIILDLMMPGLDGFSFIDVVSESEPKMCKRIIVLTAVSQRTLSRLDERRVWSVVRKPFDIDSLMRCVVACAHQDAQLAEA